MRDHPTAATGLAIALLAAIIGGAYYYLVMQHPAPVPPTPSPRAPTTWKTIAPRPGQESSVASDAPRVPAETSQGRTDTPIKCFDPEVGEFWTNAATCQSADLNKQLSNPAPQVSSSSPVAGAGADKTAENKTGTRADRAKLMGQDYMPPEEAAARSHSDKDD
jgi:hypothetical protein